MCVASYDHIIDDSIRRCRRICAARALQEEGGENFLTTELQAGSKYAASYGTDKQVPLLIIFAYFLKQQSTAAPEDLFGLCRLAWLRKDLHVVLVHPQIPQNTGEGSSYRPICSSQLPSSSIRHHF